MKRATCVVPMGDRIMLPEISKRIESHLAREEWQEVRRLVMRALKKSPNSHWYLTRLATTYYEERNYAKALLIEEKALKLAPECPLVLWDYAGSLDMIGKHKEAIAIWKKLLKRGVARIASGECGEGVRWARSLLNDCRYRIALAYWDIGNLSAALKFLRAHIAHRAPGIPSIYPLPTVNEKLTALL